MKGSGYLATVLGAAIGGFILLWPAGYLGAILEMSSAPNDGFAGLMGAVYGATIGAALGAGLGAWIALRSKDHALARPTGVLVAFVAPGSMWLSFLGFHSAVLAWVPEWAAYIGPFDTQAASLAVLSLAFVTSVVASRFAVLKTSQAFRP
jgi:hypothetical protein